MQVVIIIDVYLKCLNYVKFKIYNIGESRKRNIFLFSSQIVGVMSPIETITFITGKPA